jgi:hypothetical protein
VIRSLDDQMALVAFMQAGSTSVHAGSWRHPAADLRFLEASYCAEQSRLLEHGCCDLMFFDDRLAMPGVYGDSVADAVRYGAQHEAEAHGTGAIALDGMLVDAAHMRHADTIRFRAGLSVAS